MVRRADNARSYCLIPEGQRKSGSSLQILRAHASSEKNSHKYFPFISAYYRIGYTCIILLYVHNGRYSPEFPAEQSHNAVNRRRRIVCIQGGAGSFQKSSDAPFEPKAGYSPYIGLLQPCDAASDEFLRNKACR